MAAWIVAGILVFGSSLFWAVMDRRERNQQIEREVERRLRQMMLPQTDGQREILERVLDRLLEAVVPKHDDGSVPVPEEYQQPPGEYEEPDDARPVMDWTDPFIGLERPVVARLAPGEQIPGFAPDDDRPGDPVEVWREMGEGSFEEWVRETVVPDREIGVNDMAAYGWVEPIDLGVDDERG